MTALIFTLANEKKNIKTVKTQNYPSGFMPKFTFRLHTVQVFNIEIDSCI